MSNKLHASEGDKAVASRLYFNMIILFGLLEDFHCHCERRGSLNALPLDSYPRPCEAISLLGLLPRSLLFPFLAHCARNNSPRNDIPCQHSFALGFGSLASRRENGLSVPCRYHAACGVFFIVRRALDGSKHFPRNVSIKRG